MTIQDGAQGDQMNNVGQATMWLSWAVTQLFAHLEAHAAFYTTLVCVIGGAVTVICSIRRDLREARLLKAQLHKMGEDDAEQTQPQEP